MYNAENDPINIGILKLNRDLSDLNNAIEGDRTIMDSDAFGKMSYNSEELNALFTHSVEYTEHDQAHDRYWDRVEESDAVKLYAQSTERTIKYKWHSHDFRLHHAQCVNMLNEEQRDNLDELWDYRNQEAEEDWQY